MAAHTTHWPESPDEIAKWIHLHLGYDDSGVTAVSTGGKKCRTKQFEPIKQFRIENGDKLIEQVATEVICKYRQ